MYRRRLPGSIGGKRPNRRDFRPAATGAAGSPAPLDVRLRLAFALLRAGDTAGAEEAAREVLGHVPVSPDGLLVLGLAQRGSHSAEAPRTLRRFLTVAPTHPAAPEISRLLSTGR